MKKITKKLICAALSLMVLPCGIYTPSNVDAAKSKTYVEDYMKKLDKDRAWTGTCNVSTPDGGSVKVKAGYLAAFKLCKENGAGYGVHGRHSGYMGGNSFFYVGDVNEDGCVNTNDLYYLKDVFGEYKKLDTDYKYQAADINNDGAITMMDLIELRNFCVCYPEGVTDYLWLGIE